MAARLVGRLVRRGTLLMAAAAAIYMAVEVFTYLATYPDAASRTSLGAVQDNPAVRMLQGVPYAVDIPGGFVTWDSGWILESIIAIWAMLLTARLLRGEEEVDRTELVLAAPISAVRLVLVQCAVVAAAACLVGTAIAVVLATAGTGVLGSVLFGIAIAGFAATFGAVAAITAQLFDVRRRATGTAAAVMGGMFLMRMLANSRSGLGWLRWLTPFGWMDELHAYRDPRWVALIPLVIVPIALGALAVRLRPVRDTGGALIAQSDRRRARTALLGGPTAFAWRSTRGLLIGWLIGIAAYALMIGSVAKTLTDLVATDENYRRILQALGWDAAQVIRGYIGVMGVLLGLFYSLYACWRIGAAWTEEAAGRAENVLSRPVTRRRWLGGHIVLTLASALLIATVSALAMWAGAAATGADATIGDTIGSALNTMPLVVVFVGLAVILYGTLPRLTVGVSVTVVIAAYLVQMIGPALKWPAWVVDLSPFHHVAAVPSQPFAPIAATVLTVVGVAAMAVGAAGYNRRDLIGD
ncbi:ABC transporter permease [Nocardia tengchongensis]|uniref:ABC transporter permease n=1 Tax=Nocardia tengchongensis TaxID=2055889 RepID=UPI0036759095